MSTEITVAYLIFAGMLVISVFGYWTSSRQAEELDHRRDEQIRSSYEPIS